MLRRLSLVALLALVTSPAVVARTPKSPAAAPALTRPPELLQFVEATFPEAEQGRTG